MLELLCFAVVAVGGLAVILACTFALIVGIYRKSIPLILLGSFPLAFVLLVTAGGTIIFMTQKPVPLATQAKEYVQLPAGANVISVRPGDWAGNGWVEFRMPDTKSPDEWVTEIWDANLPANAMNQNPSWSVNQPLHKRLTYSSETHRELEYDPATKIYFYSVNIGI